MAQQTNDGEAAQSGFDKEKESDILVQGETRSSLRTFLEETLADSDERQLARFKNHICPAVLGLPKEYAAVITDRIRKNIRRVGLNTRKEP
ncbi:MAG: hypothetical protein CMN74_07175, partial [Sphingorhabdus sp.]|nr:hypothetical protein [Sphingorhabdus sp.]